jgi:uncharacterized protein YfaS (alpha-2-macroglobulin family)
MNGFRNRLKALVRILGTIFGSLTVSWRPPQWMQTLRGGTECGTLPRLAGIVREFGNRRLRPLARRTAIIAPVSLVLVAVVVLYAIGQVGLIRVSGSQPGLTRLEDAPRPDPLHLYFSGSAAQLSAVGRVVEKGISMSPSLAGEWKWTNDRTLLFVPKADWAVGQKYTVKLDRSLFPEQVKLADYTYSFKTPLFRAELVSFVFYQDPEDPKVKKVVATVRFTHPVDTASFEKRIRMRRSDQKAGFLGFGAEYWPFTVSYDKYRGEAYIHSKPMDIPEKDLAMALTIDSGIRAERGGPSTEQKLERNVSIPGKYTFLRVGSEDLTLVRNERYEPEQVLVVNTTTGVQESEIMKNLTVFLLPVDLPPIQGQQGEKNYNWSYFSPVRIGPEVLNVSERVKLAPVPRDQEFATLHGFAYTAPSGRYLYVKVNKGMEAFGGYVLARDHEAVLHVPEMPRELGFMHNGSVLSLSGEKKLSVYARDLDAVRYDIGRVLPDQINHLMSQTSGDITNPEFTNYQFTEDNISEHFSEVQKLRRDYPGQSQYASFDFSRYLKTDAATNRGLFFLQAQSWDPVKQQGTGLFDKRLILVTDLGVLVKNNSDGTHDVFVQSIHDGRPVSGARVEVLGKNGLPVFNGATDGEGRAPVPKLADFTREKEPVVYVVRKGSDLSFLPYDRSERRLNLSRFDVGGEVMAGSRDRLSAYLFSDRGLYRPGDEFHIGVIVKSADWTAKLAGIPLEAAVIDARGLEVMRRKISLSAMGFEEVSYRTEETSPTGNYTTNVYIVKDNKRGALLGSVAVRVEEFLPDRMKITTRLSKERAEGWVHPAGLKGQVTLMNLYGTAAANHRVSGEITLSPAFPAFRNYREYTFFDPVQANQSFSDELPDGVTNDRGEAEFDLPLERFDRATYHLTFIAEGFEAEGGRSVRSESSVLVSPLSYLIGYKPDGDLQYINKGSRRSVDLIAVDPTLRQIAVPGLKAQIIEVRYVSALTRQSDGTYKYQSVKKEVPASSTDLAISAQATKFDLPTGNPGDFLLIVKDARNTELNRVSFSVAGKGNLSRSLEKNAELQIRLNKTDYAPGEEIELSIRAPYTGAGLITIERDRVYATKWFKTDSASSVQRIRVPATFEGNGYVNVSFVRALDSTEIFMSPLSYGVMPFSVSREKRTVAIDLDAPDLARPGEVFKIRYKGNKSGKVVVFAVDEGILQVARYKTPDPLSHFFRKRALEVQTAQILDLILPEASVVRMLSAAGGDEGAMEAIGKNLNPFKRKRDKPVVYWSGLVDIDQTTRELSYRVPDYFNGTLRVMAVAVAPDAIGANQRKAHIRGHFVLSPNVPTFVAPGDEFIVTVGVANNVEGSGKNAAVNLELSTSEHLEVLDKGPRTMRISEGKEESASFRVRAKRILGSGRFTFTASLGGKKSTAAIEASVRPLLAYRTTVDSGSFDQGTFFNGKAIVPVTRDMYPELRRLEASASPLPLGIAHGLVAYLSSFPYGCTEQLVSQSFPAVVLKNRPEFGPAHRNANENVERVMSVLRARQNAEGSFGFWAANSHVSDHASVYAMHFLTEAKEKGFAVPPDMFSRGLAYLQAVANSGSDTLPRARTRAYAVYLLTRNGIVTTLYADAMREQLENTKATKGWKKDLTGTYLSAAYKLLKLDSKAKSLISDSRLGQPVQSDYGNFYDSLVHDTQYLYIIARHFPERFEDIKGKDIDGIVRAVSAGGYNTISSAYTVLAMDAYASAIGEKAVMDIRIQEVLDKGTRDLALPKGLFPVVAYSAEARKIRIESKSDYPTFYQVTAGGFDKALPDKELRDGIEIQREYRDSAGSVVASTSLGSELDVHVRVRSIAPGAYFGNVAIVELLPGGFEVVLDKTRGVSAQAPAPRQVRARGEDEEEGEGEGEAEEPASAPAAGWVSPIGLDSSTWHPDFVDIREDRVVLFGSVGPSMQEFVYRIKATNRGTYTVPPAYAESMYDRAIRARTLPGMMVVLEKKKEEKKEAK